MKEFTKKGTLISRNLCLISHGITLVKTAINLSSNAPKKEEERLPALHVTVNKSKPISVDIYCYTTVCIISQRKPSIYGSPSDKGRRVPLQGSARPNAKISALGLPRMTRQICVELWPIVAQHKVGLTLMKQALEPVVFYRSAGEQEQNL